MSPRPDLFSLDGRVAIVTGGAGLLGTRHAEALVEAGAAVALLDVAEDRAADAAGRIAAATGGRVLAIGADVADARSVESAVARVRAELGRIDVLVNNAAMTVKGGAARADYFAPFEQYPQDLWERALRTGLTGAYLCAQHAGRVMVEQGRGVIINVSSTYGLVGPDQRIYQGTSNPYDATVGLNTPISYSVIKSALLGMTRYLATYWAGRNIRVNALTPGGVFDGHGDTFVRNYAARTVLGRMASPDEYKGAIQFLASDASSYMTGANLVVDGGWTAW